MNFASTNFLILKRSHLDENVSLTAECTLLPLTPPRFLKRTLDAISVFDAHFLLYASPFSVFLLYRQTETVGFPVLLYITKKLWEPGIPGTHDLLKILFKIQ